METENSKGFTLLPQVEKAIEDTVRVFERAGMTAEEARHRATEQIYSMGATKTLTGKCPLGGTQSMACMFCSFGHMTECHYPQTCEEAECSHYKEEIEQ